MIKSMSYRLLLVSCYLILGWRIGRVGLGGPFGTVPELLFEKKRLIPALQQMLVAGSGPTD
jgi:hypothetical protein